MSWEIVAYAVAASLVVVFLRPWRFFRARNRCPQCQGLLPRWNAWGWRDDWACDRCGCLINR